MERKKYPVRLTNFNSPITIKGGKNIWGTGLKIQLRDVAKNHPMYFFPIDIGDVTGHDDSGNKIPINILGKWLFGVPGYMGHIRVDSGADVVTVHLPENCPEEAIQLTEEVVKSLKD